MKPSVPAVIAPVALNVVKAPVLGVLSPIAISLIELPHNVVVPTAWIVIFGAIYVEPSSVNILIVPLELLLVNFNAILSPELKSEPTSKVKYLVYSFFWLLERVLIVICLVLEAEPFIIKSIVNSDDKFSSYKAKLNITINLVVDAGGV